MNLKEKMERRLKINASGLFPVFCACVILNKEGKSQYVDKKFFFFILGGVFSCDRSIYFVYGNVPLVYICLNNETELKF